MAATDLDLRAAIAVTRFGLGGRPGEIASARSDPQGFLTAQIRSEGADLPQGDGDTSEQRIVAFRDFRQSRLAQRPDERRPQAGGEGDARDPVAMTQQMLRQETGGDILARARLGATTEAGFRERWALFWANHFTVSATKLVTATIVGPFEREAIRPHVFGRFADLLVASSTHPAMLLYLDQAQSVGPNSQAVKVMGRMGRRGPNGQARPAGLNENLAREILELHTVGVDGGYSQADVTEFARAMTGLSIGNLREGDQAGVTLFRVAAHEPGARTVMGRRYADGGKEQAGAILSDLAAKPQTALFLATKIARHFTADTPPPSLVAKLEKAYLASGGRLDEVARTLIAAPEAWDPQPAKFKAPNEFVISAYRAAGGAPRADAQFAPVLNGMGQRPFGAPSPKGWPDETAAWASPDAVVKRMTWSQGFAEAATAGREPQALAAEALGARLAPATAKAISRAETRAEGFALMLMSPEFQRR